MEHKYIKLAWIFCGECCLCRDVYDKDSKNFNKMAKERMKYAVGWCETDFTQPDGGGACSRCAGGCLLDLCRFGPCTALSFFIIVVHLFMDKQKKLN